MEERSASVLKQIPDALAELPRTDVPLTAGNRPGHRTAAADRVHAAWPCHQLPEFRQLWTRRCPSLDSLLPELEAPGHGVILAMGKGGVGKTTVAASIAVALADRGYEVHLSTTDPAAHVMATLAAESMPHLTVSRIDPVQETADYTAEVMQTAGASLDDARSCFTRRRPAFALHGRNRRVPSVRASCRGGDGQVCRPRYRSRPVTRFCCSIRHWPITVKSPGSRSRCRSRCRIYCPDYETPSSHECLIVTLARSDSGPRSHATAIRSASSRHRAVCLGHQPEPHATGGDRPHFETAAGRRMAVHRGSA